MINGSKIIGLSTHKIVSEKSQSVTMAKEDWR